MSGYQRLLLGVDFSKDTATIAARAMDLAACYQAELNVLHVVEYVPLDPGNEWMVPPEVEVEQTLMERAEASMDRLAERLGLSRERCTVALGSPKHELIRRAEESATDLIVVGSHGRHGLARILGSTANGVVHGAPCDVLAVRITD